jgi:DNA replication protein DnaC
VACELCDDTGWKPVETDGVSKVVRCDCWRARAAQQQLIAAGIPQKYRRCTFDNFQTHYDSLRAASRRAKRFVDEFPVFSTTKNSLIFQGSFGVGKTHLAVATLRETIVKGGRGYFFEVADLLKRVRDSYFGKSDTTESDVLDPVLHGDLLVLDDLGEEKTSDWVQETLAHVVNVRYSENRPTIFTTNLIDSPDSTDPLSLMVKIGGRTRSRLMEMCDWVRMDAIDTREVGPEPSPDEIAHWQETSPTSPKNVERVRKGDFPAKTGGQLKAKMKISREREGKVDLKWPGGRAGS